MSDYFFAGIDLGSIYSKVVLINDKKEVVSSAISPSGVNYEKVTKSCLEKVCREADIDKEQIRMSVGTGYGRKSIHFTDKSITEISCHAGGVFFLYPSCRTIIDVGGQDSKVINLRADGSIENFIMNDKCAAGTGRFLEVMANTMEQKLEVMNQLAFKATDELTISSVCTVFAESEIISLISQNNSLENISKAIYKSIASKITSLLSQASSSLDMIVFTGGVARNVFLVAYLEELLKTKITIPDIPQITGALGAALYAKKMFYKGK
ncbi:MAG: 2-hydroxyglutaryl-CoA dehydratase [Spirochaetales bacterium]|nr:2-hydroxyglutaryl-CoA dehydratase [Spirochaetales bacterium]